MPRRRTPDPLALAVGERVRQLREEAGLTLEQLAYESTLGSKGHLSDLERGLVRPTVATLAVLADRLGYPLLDLVTFPDRDLRQLLVDRSRAAPQALLRTLLQSLERAVPHQEAGAQAADRPTASYGSDGSPSSGKRKASLPLRTGKR